MINVIENIDNDFTLINATDDHNTNVFSGIFKPTEKISSLLDSLGAASLAKYIIKNTTTIQQPAIGIFDWDRPFSLATSFLIYKDENTKANKEPPLYCYRCLNPDYFTKKEFRTWNLPIKPYFPSLLRVVKAYNDKNQLQALGSIYSYVDGINYDDYIEGHPEDKDLIEEKLMDVLSDMKNITIKPNETINESYTGAEFFKERIADVISLMKEQKRKYPKNIQELKDKNLLDEELDKYINQLNEFQALDVKKLPYFMSLFLNLLDVDITITKDKDVVLQAPRMITYDCSFKDFIAKWLNHDIKEEIALKFINRCNNVDELLHLYSALYYYYLSNLNKILEDKIDQSTVDYKLLDKLYAGLKLVNLKLNLKPKSHLKSNLHQ